MTHFGLAGGGYDAERQRIVGFLAAGLDDQSRILGKALGDVPVAGLEWQPRPGHNTIGMIVTHCAVVEAWWLQAAPLGVKDRAEVERIVRAITDLGLDDDGMPAPADGRHPASIAGRSGADYAALLARVRDRTHATLRGWDDASLASEARISRGPVTRGWILYHVLEHLASHVGQVLRIRHDLRDAGVLPPS